MKKISIFVLILVLTVSTLSGCRRRNEADTSAPSAGTTTATQATTIPATTDSHRETQDNGIIDDIITEGSDIVDDVLPDGTTHTGGDTNGNDDTGNVRSRGVPRY